MLALVSFGSSAEWRPQLEPDDCQASFSMFGYSIFRHAFQLLLSMMAQTTRFPVEAHAFTTANVGNVVNHVQLSYGRHDKPHWVRESVERRIHGTHPFRPFYGLYIEP